MPQPPRNNRPPFNPGASPSPVPGQFSYPPAPPSRKYSNRLLALLTVVYALSWMLVAVAAVGAPNPAAAVLGNLGISLLWGVLVSVAIIDWRGLITLQGLINWQHRRGGKRLLLGFLFFAVSLLLVGVYLLRTFLVQKRQAPVGQGLSVASSRRPQVGIIVGSLVTIFVFAVYATGNPSGDGFGSSTMPSVSASPAANGGGVLSVTPTVATPQQTQLAPTKSLLASPTPALHPSPTPTPRPQTTPTLRPQPTQAPKPTPTPTPCPGVNCNPWGYNFVPGNPIDYPPTGFCNSFPCIPSFYEPDDPGDGYVVQCTDGQYSQSGGERGACSSHGGVMRELYAH